MTACGNGWHQLVSSTGTVTWFRLGVRLNDEQGTYIYRVGPEPDIDNLRTIWCYGDKGVAWTCASCGTLVSAEKYRNAEPLS